MTATPARIEVKAAGTGIPSTLALEASAVAFDVEAKAADGTPRRPRFDIVGYTGAPMNVACFYSPVIVDLAGLKAKSQEIPALRGHDDDRIVGQTDSVKIDAQGVRLTGSITGDNADATEVVTQSKNGFKWQASIGAGIDRREFLEAGKTATVNGREVAGPLVIAREATVYEISFVAIGADGQTSASVAASHPPGSHSGDHHMNFDAWLQAKGFDPTALSDTQRASLRAAFDAEEAKPKPDHAQAKAVATLEDIFASARKEEERVARITEITAAAVRERPMMMGDLERMSRAAIEAKAAPEEYELNVLRLRARVAPGGFAAHTADRKMGAKVIEAALCLGGRLEGVERHYDEHTLEASSVRYPHGLGLQETLLIVARENGYTGHSFSDLRGVLRAAFGGNQIRADGFSTLSLPGILSNVANKFLAVGFHSVEDGWRQVAATRPVRDFKQVSSYSLTGGMMYEKVGPTGELKHTTVGELKYTNQAETYGRMLAVTRQDLINDDLGALTKIPQKLGRGAALKLNDVFWTAFLSNVSTLFTTGNTNVLTGGISALSAAALGLALAKFRKQTDPDGFPIGITPTVLLVPPELEIAALNLVTATAFNTGGSSTTDQVPNRNPWAGKFKVVVASYLSNTNYTGYSTTAWYLLADPADLAAIEAAFLNGREMPIVESADADFNTLGIQMRGYHDFGVSVQEFRAGLRAAGV